MEEIEPRRLVQATLTWFEDYPGVISSSLAEELLVVKSRAGGGGTITVHLPAAAVVSFVHSYSALAAEVWPNVSSQEAAWRRLSIGLEEALDTCSVLTSELRLDKDGFFPVDQLCGEELSDSPREDLPAGDAAIGKFVPRKSLVVPPKPDRDDAI